MRHQASENVSSKLTLSSSLSSVPEASCTLATTLTPFGTPGTLPWISKTHP